MISIYILAILIFIFFFILLKKLQIKKDIIVCIVLTFFTILFFSNMEVALLGVKSGLILCFNSIIPSIFSFSVICNLLIAFNGINIYSKLLGKIICKPFRLSINCSFILIASFLCGYPLGAKYAGEAYENSLISFKEYERILNIASNASPIFILGVLGVSFLGNIQYGYIILFSNFISILIISFLTKPTFSPPETSKYKKTPPNFGEAFQKAIENGLMTTLTVCGYVITFSLIITLLKNINFIENGFTLIESLLNLPSHSLYGLFLGSIEITNGCSIISEISLPLNLKISILSFFCCFSGLSIIFQTSSFFKSKRISLLKYSLLKLVQGVIGFISSFIISSLFLDNIKTSIDISTFTPQYSYIIFTLLLILLPLIFNKCRLILFKSL